MNSNVEQLQKDILALRQELDSKEKLLQQIQLSETVKQKYNQSTETFQNVKTSRPSTVPNSIKQKLLATVDN